MVVFSPSVGQIERELRIWSPLSKLFNRSHGFQFFNFASPPSLRHYLCTTENLSRKKQFIIILFARHTILHGAENGWSDGNPGVLYR
jgi:hypothetical protein